MAWSTHKYTTLQIFIVLFQINCGGKIVRTVQILSGLTIYAGSITIQVI